LPVSRESESPTREGLSGKPGGAVGDETSATPRVEVPHRSGEVLGGRYRVEQVLGFGGMGVVYRARDLKLDSEIALKRIRPDRFAPEQRETLRREIILARKVTHENVCRVYDLVEVNGEEFVSMEYLPGRTLKDLEQKERILPLGRGLAIAKGICDGLAAAHRIGVLHRDLKPENVMVGEDGKPRLMDFGIAVESGGFVPQGETVPGTPQFLAPELLQGAAPTVRTDVYAMGVVLFEMFTGRVPIDDDNTARLVRRIVRETPPSVASLRPDLPRDLSAILDRAIAKDPEARFPDATALADAIAAFEGQVLDRVLAEVSVTRAKMIKLMVILEANKSLAATFDPSETLRIILRTATSETDAQRGTIFLKDPATGELVSQILEGGSVAPIRLPAGRGIAGSVASTGEIVNVGDAYNDRRFDSRTDAGSGFHTVSILAAPMRTPAGEIVGVVEILNKRRGSFTKEDEEFLAEVGTHAALAVAGDRRFEESVRQARREGAARALRGTASFLVPHAWPDTPGFESAPLRWSSDELSLLGFAVDAAPGRLSFVLVEPAGEPEDSLGSLLRALEAGRNLLPLVTPEEIVAAITALGPECSAAAARWEGDTVSSATAGGVPSPTLFRAGRPLPGGTPATSGDILVVASTGLHRLRPPPRSPVEQFGWLAAGQPLSAAFARLVADWKREGVTAGDRDVLLLAARRT
jgi:serine/threonine protein kinase/putative methionine-R-sulfoxide reductase with GAF domain